MSPPRKKCALQTPAVYSYSCCLPSVLLLRVTATRSSSPPPPPPPPPEMFLHFISLPFLLSLYLAVEGFLLLTIVSGNFPQAGCCVPARSFALPRHICMSWSVRAKVGLWRDRPWWQHIPCWWRCPGIRPTQRSPHTRGLFWGRLPPPPPIQHVSPVFITSLNLHAPFPSFSPHLTSYSSIPLSSSIEKSIIYRPDRNLLLEHLVPIYQPKHRSIGSYCRPIYAI